MYWVQTESQGKGVLELCSNDKKDSPGTVPLELVGLGPRFPAVVSHLDTQACMFRENKTGNFSVTGGITKCYKRFH